MAFTPRYRYRNRVTPTVTATATAFQNLAINTVVWTANRDYPPVSSNSTIEFTRDGRLILNHTQQGTDRVLSASMLDSGNFVIYNNDSSVIQQSFDFPTDTILGNQTLFHGQRLVSSASSSFDHSSGRYRLQMQVDGNLVAFPINCFDSDFAYASASASSLPGANGCYNLTITISSLRLLTLAKASASGASPLVIIYRAMLDNDGIFRLYSHRFASYNTSSNVLIEWSMLQDHCKVYGFCGFNSNCSITTGTQADCYCYPGFVLVNPSKKFLGCYMNFTDQHCRNKEGFGLVNITTLEKLRWFGLAYSVVPANNKEDCKKSCLEDCRCGAAMYVSGQCNKHKLPLRYGTRNLSDSDTYTAFVKFTSTTAPAKIPNQIAPHSPSGPMVVTENKGHLISILAGSLGSLACLCIVIAISSFFLYRHRVHKYKKLSDNAKFGLSIDEFSLRSFSYNELAEVTQDFREEMGRGSFGAVAPTPNGLSRCSHFLADPSCKRYAVRALSSAPSTDCSHHKGTLVSGGGNKNIVAVKRLENIVKKEGDMEFQFQIEVTAIGRTHHRNLIICSRRNIEVNVSNEDEMIISTSAYKCFVRGELHKLLVGDEEMRVDSKTVERMVRLGLLLCVQDDPGMRPSIKDVILMLEGTMNIPVPPPPYPISLQ
ncbi:hypothetical protein HYC85_007435 [Camellia sinensis]|uniref:Protein kinase domain-containing protein n=1 Tax=Camellia sinensis TaxID=4442 RepID=A0A7J7HPK2_CAMSI|nr:hypothetical protein HYC85_007435 [Camellia sinensis]